MGSPVKEKKRGKSTDAVTGTLSKNVDNVDILSTQKFTGDRQRVRKDQLNKINKIAAKYGRKSFPDVLDLLLFCYDFLEDVADKYNLPGVSSATKFVQKHLPVNDFEIIVSKVVELLDEVGVNGEDRKILEKELISILKSVKIDRKSAIEILKPLMLVRSNG